MTTYNTGNAIGSSDARDLYDNAENIDNFANGSANAFNDRFGVSRKSIAGMESEFDTFIQSAGYTTPVAYASGIVLSVYNQLIEYSGEFYKLKAGQAPYTTTGTWGTDSAKLVSVGDATLRQELTANANDFNLLPEVGNYAALRAYTGDVTAYYVRGVANIFDGGAGVFRVNTSDTTTADNGGTVLVDATGRRWKREFSGSINVKWFGAAGNGIADDSQEIQAALNFAATLASYFFQASGNLVNSNDPAVEVEFPPGKYLVSSQLYSNATRIRIFGHNVLIWSGANGVLDSSYLFKFNSAFDVVIDGISFGSTLTGCVEFNCANISSAMVKITNCAFMGRISSGNAVGTAIKYKNQSSNLLVENCKFRDVKHAMENILGDMVRFSNCWFDNNYPKTYSDDSGYFNNIFGYFTVEDCMFAGGPGDKGARVAYFNCDRDIQLTIRRCRVAFEGGGGPLINWKVPIVLTNGSLWRNGFLIDDITTAPRGQDETYHNRSVTPLVRLYQMPNRMVFKNLSWVNTIQALIGVAPTTTLETLYQAAIAQDRRYSQLAYRYEDSVGNEMYLVPTADKLIHKKWMRLFNIFNYSFEVESPGNAVTHYIRTFFTDAELNAGLFEVSAFMTTGADRRKSQQWIVTTQLDPTAATRSFTTTTISGSGSVDGQNITLTPKFREISTGTYTDTIPFAAAPSNYELAFELTRVGPNTFNFPEFYVRPMRAFNVASPTTGTPRQFFAPSI